MAITLPTQTKTIDDLFIDTWYEVREEAIDNILAATPVWNALMGAGCGTEQIGGEMISRTIKYANSTATPVQKGDLLTTGEPQLETLALWSWKHIAHHIQRNIIDDQKNAGPNKRKDYVSKRIVDAVDAFEQLFETKITGAFQSSEDRDFNSLHDLVPPIANRTTGSFGGITRPSAFAATNGIYEPSAGNTFWGSKYRAGTLASVDVDLLTDMKTLYNAAHNNQSPPNLILTDKTLFELYEEYGVDISQIIKDETSRLVDLGFEVLRFKGKPMMWSGNMTANHMLMLNCDFIELVYDPNLWFALTDWKPEPRGMDRIAHIFCAVQAITTQPRRHGRLEYA